MSDTEKAYLRSKLDILFEKLVPAEGKADTVAGEIVRATSHVGYRYYNDGDFIGEGYGNETCNPPARYLKETCGGKIAETVDNMWGIYNEDRYKEQLNELFEHVITYLDEHPELEKTENTDDMWKHDDPYVDRDDSYDYEDEDFNEDYDDYEDEEDEEVELSDDDLDFGDDGVEAEL